MLTIKCYRINETPVIAALTVELNGIHLSLGRLPNYLMSSKIKPFINVILYLKCVSLSILNNM
jgi:hypothetical protein